MELTRGNERKKSLFPVLLRNLVFTKEIVLTKLSHFRATASNTLLMLVTIEICAIDYFNYELCKGKVYYLFAG